MTDSKFDELKTPNETKKVSFKELKSAFVQRGAKTVSAVYTSSNGNDGELSRRLDVDCDYDSASDLEAAKKVAQLAGASIPKIR